MTTQVKITVQQLIKTLLDEEKPVHPRYLHRLSDLPSDEQAELQKAWPQVPAWRRLALMDDLEDLSEENYTLSFEAIARIAGDDTDPAVREAALRVLWDYETPELIAYFLDKLAKDPAPAVRAVAASGLGKYVYLGETEELSPKKLRTIEERLLALIQGDQPDLVRRRALESMGFSSREEVPGLIETAYKSGNKDWLASALFAMGRSANKSWEPYILEQIQSDNPEICGEAARAAGELEITKAKPRLLKLLKDDDVDVRAAAAWSLSQIGGDGVQKALEAMLEDTEDDEEIEFIDAALENLAFTEETNLFGLLELDEEDDIDTDEDDFEIDLDDVLDEDE